MKYCEQSIKCFRHTTAKVDSFIKIRYNTKTSYLRHLLNILLDTVNVLPIITSRMDQGDKTVTFLVGIFVCIIHKNRL